MLEVEVEVVPFARAFEEVETGFFALGAVFFVTVFFVGIFYFDCSSFGDASFVGTSTNFSACSSTTTSLLGNMYRDDGKQPTIVVGAKVPELGGNFCLGSGNTMILEADESDASFLAYQPENIVITNIDDDHCSNLCTFPTCGDGIRQMVCYESGYDIVFIIDSSDSVGEEGLSMVKTAFVDFADSLLSSTNTEIAVVDFDSMTTITQTYTNNMDDMIDSRIEEVVYLMKQKKGGK